MINKEYERRRELFRYLDIPNTDQVNISKKWYGLRTMGWTEEQCEAECTPKEIDREKELEEIREMQKKELKELAKYNREQVRMMKEEAQRKDCIEGLEIGPESLYRPVDELEEGLGA